MSVLPAPVVEKVFALGTNIIVVHDQTKRRIAQSLLTGVDERHIIYPGGVDGESVPELMRACALLNKKPVFVFNRASDTPQNADLIQSYRDNDADVHFVIGNDNDAFAKARTLAQEMRGKVVSFADEHAISVVTHSLADALLAQPPITDAFVAVARGGFFNGLERAINHANAAKGHTGNVRMNAVRIVNLQHDFNGAALHDGPFTPGLGIPPHFGCNAIYEETAWRKMTSLLANSGGWPGRTVLFYNGSVPDLASLKQKKVETCLTYPDLEVV